MAFNDKDDVADVIAQLQIVSLLSEYTHAIDDKRPEAWADCFTPDGRFEVGEYVLKGRDSLLAYAQVHATITSRHVATSPLYQIASDGMSATGRSSVVVMVATRHGFKMAMTGGYDDELVKTDKGWRIARRRVMTDAFPDDPNLNLLTADPDTSELAQRLLAALASLSEPVGDQART